VSDCRVLSVQVLTLKTEHTHLSSRIREHFYEGLERQVVDVVLNPARLERRDGQFFAVKLLDSKHGLRVVYEKRKGFLVVITFYPVRRERYGL